MLILNVLISGTADEQKTQQVAFVIKQFQNLC